MKVITVCSHKGGVGKTTTALNLCLSVAGLGYRTLLVDVDPQGAIGLSLGRERMALGGLVEVLAGRSELLETVVRTRVRNLALLPVGRMEMRLSHAFERHLDDGGALSQLVEQARGSFDMMFFDAPAGFGGATMGALRASHFAISPMSAEPLTLRGAPEVIELMVRISERSGDPQFLGFIATMVDRQNPVSLDVLAEARDRFGREFIFDTAVPRDTSFSAASAAGVPLKLLSRTPPSVAAVFDNLALEFEQRIEALSQRRQDGSLPFVD